MQCLLSRFTCSRRLCLRLRGMSLPKLVGEQPWACGVAVLNTETAICKVQPLLLATGQALMNEASAMIPQETGLALAQKQSAYTIAVRGTLRVTSAKHGPAEDEHETWNCHSYFALRAGSCRIFHREQMGDPPRIVHVQ